MAGLLLLCVCELVQILGVLFLYLFLFCLVKSSHRGASRCCLNNLPAALYPLWRLGLGRELNIYTLHVKIILKIANRCRTAVCRTCLHEDDWCCCCRRKCAWERNRKRSAWGGDCQEERGEKSRDCAFFCKSFTLLVTLCACVSVCGWSGVTEWSTQSTSSRIFWLPSPLSGFPTGFAGPQRVKTGRQENNSRRPGPSYLLCLWQVAGLWWEEGIKFYHNDLACVVLTGKLQSLTKPPLCAFMHAHVCVSPCTCVKGRGLISMDKYQKSIH